MALHGGGCDLDFRKRIALHRANLFETNQFKQGKESYHDLDARCGGREQFRKTHGSSRPRRVAESASILSETVKFSPKISVSLLALSTRLITIWNALINWKIPTSPRRSGALVSVVGAAIARKYLFLLELPDLQLLRRFLELLVFDQLPNQFPARIIFVDIFLRRLLIDRQQAAALQVNQIRRHDDELAGDLDVQFLERLEIFEVLPRDALERDIVDVDLVALDQIKQEIERTFENSSLTL